MSARGPALAQASPDPHRRRTIKYALWFTAGLFIAGTATAAEVTLVPGTYVKTDVYDRAGLILNDNSRPSEDEPEMLVLRQGNRIRTVDQKTKVTYTIDLDHPTEVSDGRANILENMKMIPVRTFYGVIDHFSLSDFRAENPTRVTGYANGYFASKSIFGVLRGRLRVGVTYDFLTCKIRKDDESLGGRVVIPGYCVREHLGTSVDFVSVDTGLGFQLNNFIGLILDTTFKIFSPHFASETFYYRKN